VSETSSAEHRGGFLGYVFIANCTYSPSFYSFSFRPNITTDLGISIAYWLSFGLSFINNGYSDIRWRFLLAFQCIPALFLVLFVKMLPDSPRYLASVGRNEEARDLLYRVRGHKAAPEEIEKEYLEIVALAMDSKPSSPIQFAKILLGRSGRRGSNMGRRAWLCLWLQIMASWTGITAVTAYSPVLLRNAGYSELKQNGLAGGLNTIGIIGTIISAHIVDRIGRRTCLMAGSGALAAVNLIVSQTSMAISGDGLTNIMTRLEPSTKEQDSTLPSQQPLHRYVPHCPSQRVYTDIFIFHRLLSPCSSCSTSPMPPPGARSPSSYRRRSSRPICALKETDSASRDGLSESA
jgi:hypothetical protein